MDVCAIRVELGGAASGNHSLNPKCDRDPHCSVCKSELVRQSNPRFCPSREGLYRTATANIVSQHSERHANRESKCGNHRYQPGRAFRTSCFNMASCQTGRPGTAWCRG